jgi:prepilin signal peptidase PulO-like enzyme (type II secretory pathway)
MLLKYITVFFIGVVLWILSGWFTTAHFRSFYSGKLFTDCVCDQCGSTIDTKFTFPIIGYCVLKGKTRCCSQNIPVKYLVWEIVFFVWHIAVVLVFISKPFVCAAILFAGFMLFLLTSFILRRFQGINYRNVAAIVFLAAISYGALSLMLCLYRIVVVLAS